MAAPTASADSVTPVLGGAGVTEVQGGAINGNGDVVGGASVSGGTCGFLWSAATQAMNTLTPASGSGCANNLASALNDSDEVAGLGTYEFTLANTPPPNNQSEYFEATTWAGTTSPTGLGAACTNTDTTSDAFGEPGGSEALAVNAGGTAGGSTYTDCPTPTGDHDQSGYFGSAWLGSPSNVIATPASNSGMTASTVAVNSSGTALVYYGPGSACYPGQGGDDCPTSPPSATLYPGGATLPVVPSEGGTEADYAPGPQSLNDSGVVVGYDGDSTDLAPTPAFSDAGGSAIDLTPADGYSDGVAAAVNSNGDVVGTSGNGYAADVATLWPGAAASPTPSTEPTGIDLNKLLPADTGLTLQGAIGINDKGQILAWGQGAEGDDTQTFVLTPLIVNTTADLPESNSAAPGICDDGSGACTLRAAIAVANAAPGGASIAFDIPGETGVPKISLGSPLPAITNLGTVIDATTQPGTQTGHPGVQVDGSGAGATADGLQVNAADVVVRGLALTGFGGEAVDVGSTGTSTTVQGCWIGVDATGALVPNHVGIAVAASKVSIGGSGTGQGNVISGNGDMNAFQASEGALSADSPTAADGALAAAGGGIVVDGTGELTDLAISGDTIGPEPSGADAGAYSNSVGIVLEGQVFGATIGGSGAAADAISDDVVGIATMGGQVQEPTIEGDLIGPLPGGSTANDTGDGVGVYSAGAIAMVLGAAGAGNTFQDDMVGAALIDQADLSAASNTFGADEGVPGDSRSDLIGLALVDSLNGQIGGSDTQGNQLTGDQIGLLVTGKGSSGNTISGNTIGRATDLGTSASQLDDAGMGSVFGVLLAGGSGTTVTGNRVEYAGLGVGIAGSNSNTISSNKLIGNFFGVWTIAGSDNKIGTPGAGNTIQRNDVGVLVLNENLPQTEQDYAGLPATSDADQVQRDQDLNATGDADALDLVNASSTSTVGQSTVNVAAGTATGNTIQGNAIGGSGQGNNVGVVLGGALSGTLVGGSAAADANTISYGHEAGVWVLGWPGSEPSAAMLGNSIFDNYDGSIGGDPAGLGIDLAGIDQNGGPEPGNSFGPNAVDHSPQPDPNGPNGLQNFPVLTGAVPSDGAVHVTGSLTSAARQTYEVELFASTACNPFGRGEGQRLIGDQTVTTGADGAATISATVPLSLSGAKVITATATSESDGTPVATSEFSPCETVGSHPSPPAYTGASAGGGTSTVSGGGATETVSCPSDSDGDCVGTIEIEMTLTCTTRQVTAGTCQDIGPESDLASAAAEKRKPKRHRVTFVLGSAHFKIAPGKHAKVMIHLKKTAQKLLAKSGRLKTALLVTSHDAAGEVRKRTSKVTLRLAKRPKKKKKRK